jgi:hypothetical protein
VLKSVFARYEFDEVTWWDQRYPEFFGSPFPDSLLSCTRGKRKKRKIGLL